MRRRRQARAEETAAGQRLEEATAVRREQEAKQRSERELTDRLARFERLARGDKLAELALAALAEPHRPRK